MNYAVFVIGMWFVAACSSGARQQPDPAPAPAAPITAAPAPPAPPDAAAADALAKSPPPRLGNMDRDSDDPPATLATGKNASACPATFASATGSCGVRTSCTYPEGSCICAPPPWCGGAAPPRDRPSSWQCTPKVRADGCPGQQPNAGHPCDKEGQTCDYTCSCAMASVCKKHHWETRVGPCKP